jgi:hypothetical protein
MSAGVDRFDAVRACAIALLGGVVLHASDVSAGNGKVIDWRTLSCGDALLESADAFDVARLFVSIVGSEAALRAVAAKGVVRALPAPRVTAFMLQANGGRSRSFEVAGFRVMVEAHADDDEQAAFTEQLAALSMTLA